MIRWTEQQDVLRLDVGDRARALVATLLCILLFVQCGFFALVSVDFLVGGGPWKQMSVSLFLSGSSWAFSRVVFAVGEGYRERAGWVELAVRGGLARWGGPDAPEMKSPVRVSRFEVVIGERNSLSIDALVPDGPPRRVFGPWDRMEPTFMARVVEELNANLGTVESSEATVVAPPPRMDLEERPALRAAVDRLASHSGPFRFDLRRPGHVVIPAVAGVLSLVVWASAGFPQEALWPILGASGLMLAFIRHLRIPWVEVASPGGHVRWGVRSVVEQSEIEVRQFDAESQGRFVQDPTRWVLVAVLADQSRVRLFRGRRVLPRSRAICTALLLNSVLAPGVGSPETR